MIRASAFRVLCGAGLLAIFSNTISKNPALPLLGGLLAAGVVFCRGNPFAWRSSVVHSGRQRFGIVVKIEDGLFCNDH